MGNGPSNRRQSAPLPRLFPHPPGYPGARPSPPPPPTIPPYFYPTNFSSHFYSHPYSPNNAPYLMSLPPPGFRLSGSHSSPPRVPVTEHQKARTIQNDVNVKKTTLKLVKDEQNPGFYLVSFAFDATVPGSISIFFLVKEGPNCTLAALKPDLFKPVRVPFEKGLGQNFSQASGTGVNLSLYSAEELLKDGQDEIYTLIIRTETLSKNGPTDSPSTNNVTVGGPLPKWVNSQTTHATIESKDDGGYYPKVLKQIIWVDGVRYELQEIYGIETNATGANFDGTDAGKECVICLSEPRDTTVLPCRHMCMCSECAKVLRFQTNRCPICRCVVEQLLEIKVPKTDSPDKVGCSSKSSSGC